MKSKIHEFNNLNLKAMSKRIIIGISLLILGTTSSSVSAQQPYAKGIKRGQSIEPLYKTVPKIAQKDKSLYELLALTDTLRVGRAREIKIAIEELEKRMKYAK